MRTTISDSVSLAYCATENLLSAAATAGGIEEVTITKVSGGKTFTLCITIASTKEKLFLATHRHPNKPRYFSTIETAIEKAAEIGPVRKFTVITPPAQ